MDVVKIGQAGGYGGEAFSEWIIPDGAHIREVHLKAGAFVDAIHIFYGFGANGQTEALPRMGGEGGEPYVFTLGKDEYVTGISGRSGDYIDGIQIHTNKRVSDYVGGDGGEQEFTFLADNDSELVGIFGRQDWYIDALGIVTRPRTSRTAAKPKTKKAAPKKAKAKATAKTPAKKAKLNLLVINGIGPRTNRLLADNGIVELTDLAKANVKKLRVLLDEAGAGFRKYDPSTWVDEAKALVKAKK